MLGGYAAAKVKPFSHVDYLDPWMKQPGIPHPWDSRQGRAGELAHSESESEVLIVSDSRPHGQPPDSSELLGVSRQDPTGWGGTCLHCTGAGNNA